MSAGWAFIILSTLGAAEPAPDCQRCNGFNMQVSRASPRGVSPANIFDFGFTSNVTINVGDTVTWTNTGNNPHTVTDEITPRRFDSGTLNNGQTFSHTFNTVGVYPYFCLIHTTMRGTVTVVDMNAGTPTIELNASFFNVNASQGLNPANLSFTVRNSANSTLIYSIADTVSWLSCSPANGESNGEADPITIQFNTAGLPQGIFGASIMVSDPLATNSLQTINLALTIGPPQPMPLIGVSFDSLSPGATQGQNPSDITFLVRNTGTGVLDYSIGSDVSWLRFDPTTGISTGEEDPVRIVFDTSLLPAGTHPATISVASPGALNSPRTIAVTLTLSAPPVTNSPPQIVSGPSAVPAVVRVGDPVTFAVIANDPDADPLKASWVFGDGIAGEGATISHAFASVGTFNASVEITDGKSPAVGGSVSVVVLPLPPDGDADGEADDLDVDDDNDGALDSDEIAAGSDPLDPASRPPIAMTVTMLRCAANYRLGGRDTFKVAGVLPTLRNGFSPAGAMVVLDVAGASTAYVLNSKGIGRSADGQIELKPQGRHRSEFNGRPVIFKASRRRGDFAEAWADEGADPAKSVSSTPEIMVIHLSIGDDNYRASVPTTYSAKAGRYGRFQR